MDAGDVAGGRHHAALATANDDRLVGKLRRVPLFHRGIEGIAIDMGERQRIELVMLDHPRAAAGDTPAPLRGQACLKAGQAIPAECRVTCRIERHGTHRNKA